MRRLFTDSRSPCVPGLCIWCVICRHSLAQSALYTQSVHPYIRIYIYIVYCAVHTTNISVLERYGVAVAQFSAVYRDRRVVRPGFRIGMATIPILDEHSIYLSLFLFLSVLQPTARVFRCACMYVVLTNCAPRLRDLFGSAISSSSVMGRTSRCNKRRKSGVVMVLEDWRFFHSRRRQRRRHVFSSLSNYWCRPCRMKYAQPISWGIFHRIQPKSAGVYLKSDAYMDESNV